MSGRPAQEPAALWVPKFSIIFRLVVVARLLAAMYTYISDCDETFNYWEPTHWLVRSSGWQTWEYSPEYALRSYAYLLPHAALAKLLSFIVQREDMIFYVVRGVLGVVCAYVETHLFETLAYHVNKQVAWFFLIFQCFSPGMMMASVSFLPSSFTMYTTTIAISLWIRNQDSYAVFFVALGALLGWPFAAAAGAPIALDMLVRGRLVSLITASVASLVIILLPMLAIDSFYYGRLTVAPLNIVMYNVFGGGGPELYGVEPMSYYFWNGLLNFNVAFLLSLITPGLLIFAKYVGAVRFNKRNEYLWSVYLTPLMIWFMIFFSTPHKEERFLYTVYPLISMHAGVSLYCLESFGIAILSRITVNHAHLSGARHLSGMLSTLLLTAFVILSLSRSAALIIVRCPNYRAPMQLYSHLLDTVAPALDPGFQTVHVCVGREWHRFPNSFFLPANNKVQLKFIESEFRAQLPQPYATGPDASRRIPSNMNDMNREEKSRYTPITECQFLVDIDLERETPFEPRYSKRPEWTVVAAFPYLDSVHTTSLHRAFYIPGMRSKVRTADYVLLKRK